LLRFGQPGQLPFSASFRGNSGLRNQLVHVVCIWGNLNKLNLGGVMTGSSCEPGRNKRRTGRDGIAAYACGPRGWKPPHVVPYEHSARWEGEGVAPLYACFAGSPGTGSAPTRGNGAECVAAAWGLFCGGSVRAGGLPLRVQDLPYVSGVGDYRLGLRQ